MKTIPYLIGLLILAFTATSFAAGPPHRSGFSKTPRKQHSELHQKDQKPLCCFKKAQAGTSKVSPKAKERSNRNRKPYHRRVKGH